LLHLVALFHSVRLTLRRIAGQSRELPAGSSTSSTSATCTASAASAASAASDLIAANLPVF
jgi:hypothetical protein